MSGTCHVWVFLFFCVKYVLGSRASSLTKENCNNALSTDYQGIFYGTSYNFAVAEGFNLLIHIYPLKEQLMKIASHLD